MEYNLLSEDEIQCFSPDMQDEIREVSKKFDTSILQKGVSIEKFVNHLIEIGLFKNIQSVKSFLIDESLTQLRLYNHDLPIVYYNSGEKIEDVNVTDAVTINKNGVASNDIDERLDNKNGE